MFDLLILAFENLGPLIILSIFVCLVLFTIFDFYHEKFISKNCKKFVHLDENTAIYCSQIIVFHANVFL